MSRRATPRWRSALVALAAAGGCGGPPADNAHIQTPDDRPIGPPKLATPGAGPAVKGAANTPVADDGTKVRVEKR